MDDLIADFVAECREMLEALGGEIVAWEAQPDDRARLDSIFRFVHTVKGNCGFFEFPRLEALSHAAEDALADVRAGRRLRESPTDVSVDGAFERLSAIIADMRDAITRTRMQRIENLFVGLPRMIRDLSADLGKQVLVDIEGGDVELDREMIEMIRDPLTHIIRNAVDHGIELPADRLKAGKREIGILSVSARQSGNQILID